MSPRTRTPRPRTPLIWREALPVNATERQRFWAVRHHRMLRVLVVRGANEAYAVHAFVNVPPESSMRWAIENDAALEATIDVAKQWAENEADRLATTAGQQ